MKNIKVRKIEAEEYLKKNYYPIKNFYRPTI